MEEQLQAIATVLSLVNPLICGVMFARIEAFVGLRIPPGGRGLTQEQGASLSRLILTMSRRISSANVQSIMMWSRRPQPDIEAPHVGHGSEFGLEREVLRLVKQQAGRQRDIADV
jgi:hypothetical protein